MITLTNDLVLQPPERQIGLGEEVAAATGRIEECQRGQFVLERLQTAVALPLHLLFQDGVELAAQVVQEKRVDDLVDILYRGVVHTAASTGLRIQRALEDGSEDGGRNLAPVEVERGILEQQLADGVRHAGYLNLLVGKQPAIGIGECQQVLPQIRVTLLHGRIHHFEQPYQRIAQFLCRVVVQEVMEHVVSPEDACILGIETEHQTDTKDVERLQRVLVGGVDVLFQQFVVESAHNLARLHRHLHLLGKMLALRVNEEMQAVILLAQILQEYLLRLAVGLLHVVDQELGEVAGHNPPCPLAVGQLGVISLTLLEGCQQRAVALFDGCPQVLSKRFLLDNHFGRGQVYVNEVCLVHLHLFLEADES